MRPKLRRGGWTRHLLFAASVAVSTFVFESAAQAQSNWWVSDEQPASAPREVFIGSITTRQRESQPRTGVAADLLSDGLEALRRGDVLLGRRRLEAVIEAYPDSEAAATARGELNALYSTRTAGNPRSLPVGKAAQRDDINSAERAALDKEAVERERQARLDERRLVALGYDFQTATGDRIFFAENSVDIGARARAVLATQARWLARHPELPVVIEAHADDSSSTSRDLDVQLSERRARAVQERLVEQGVEQARITIVAFGRDRPVAICQAPECAAQNRRVVTRVGHAPLQARQGRGIDAPALAKMPPLPDAPRRD